MVEKASEGRVDKILACRYAKVLGCEERAFQLRKYPAGSSPYWASNHLNDVSAIAIVEDSPIKLISSDKQFSACTK